MDQHQGAILDNNGQPTLSLHVSFRVSGTKWKGTIESPVPVSTNDRPEQNKSYRLRLANGQERTILIGPVTPFAMGKGVSFRASFTSSGPSPAPHAQTEQQSG